ncbi:MAG: ComEC/Rec2 family competence protein [Chthoniobacterales bacterium]|nr:ComEC/Rec2 family competence protein [Chthoniobacterales bacterium]
MNCLRQRNSFPIQNYGKRFPFAPVLLFAAIGILLGESLNNYLVPSNLLLYAIIIIPLISLFGCFFFDNKVIFPLALILTFSSLHIAAVQFNPANLLQQALGKTPRTVEVLAVVASEPSRTPTGWHFRAKLQQIRPFPSNLSLPTHRIKTDITVSCVWKNPVPPSFADQFLALGSIKPIPPPTNPGEFNLRNWYFRKKILHQITIPNGITPTIRAKNQLPPIFLWANHSRIWIQNTLSRGIDNFQIIKSIILATTIGDTSELPGSILDDFRVSGTMHIFSVSGLHVTMLAFIFYLCFKPFLLTQWVLVLTISLLVFFYSAVTGLNPASLRAAFMASVLLASSASSRPANQLNALFAAGFLLLLFNTHQLFDAGFQLSFTVVAAILLLTRHFSQSFFPLLAPDPFLPPLYYTPLERLHSKSAWHFSNLLAVSISAWLGSLPLIAYYYQFISLSAIPANLFAAPIAFLLLATAVLSLISSCFWSWLSVIFNHANLFFTQLLLLVVQTAANLPLSWFPLNDLLPKKNDAEVIFFDFSAGDSTAITLHNSITLIDTGSPFYWRKALAPWLAANGNKLSLLILTHGDSRHVSATLELLKSIHIPYVIIPRSATPTPSLRKILSTLQQLEKTPTTLSAGDSFKVSNSHEFLVLFPPSCWKTRDSDSSALVTKWNISGLSLLHLSDAGYPAEQWLLNNIPNLLKADILTLGLNSNRIPNSPEFLDAVKPRLIIASTADFPPGQLFPTDYLASIRSRGILLIQKKDSGAIIVEIDNKVVNIKKFADKQIIFSWLLDSPPR